MSAHRFGPPAIRLLGATCIFNAELHAICLPWMSSENLKKTLSLAVSLTARERIGMWQCQILILVSSRWEPCHFNSVRTFTLRRSNSLYSHECAVESRPRRPNRTATFSVCVGIVRVSGLRHGTTEILNNSSLLAPTLQNCVVRRLTFWFAGHMSFYCFTRDQFCRWSMVYSDHTTPLLTQPHWLKAPWADRVQAGCPGLQLPTPDDCVVPRCDEFRQKSSDVEVRRRFRSAASPSPVIRRTHFISIAVGYRRQCDNYNLESHRRCNNMSRMNFSGYV